MICGAGLRSVAAWSGMGLGVRPYYGPWGTQGPVYYGPSVFSFTFRDSGVTCGGGGDISPSAAVGESGS